MKQKNKLKQKDTPIEISDEDLQQKKSIDNNKTNKTKFDLDNIKGVLLTDQFLMSKFGTKNDNDDTDETSESDEEIKKMIEYFNSNEENSDEESIFLV